MYLIEAASGTGKIIVMQLYLRLPERLPWGSLISMKQISKHIQWSNGSTSENTRWVCFSGFQDLRLFTELTALKHPVEEQPDRLQEKGDPCTFRNNGYCRQSSYKGCGKLSSDNNNGWAFIRALPAFRLYLLDEPISHLDDCNGRSWATCFWKKQEDKKPESSLLPSGNTSMNYPIIMFTPVIQPNYDTHLEASSPTYQHRSTCRFLFANSLAWWSYYSVYSFIKISSDVYWRR